MAERPNVNPTPRQLFQQSPTLLTKHRELIGDLHFQAGIETGLAHYQRLLCDQKLPSFNDAAVNHFKMQGAMEFVAILRSLAETAELPPKTVDNSRIDHTK